MNGLVVVSPHLDDAVFSCGELLASSPGATVVTVFAGMPAESWPLPDWDAACGFASARQAIAARRREDRAALERLGAQPCWLGCLDRQYRRGSDAEGAASRLARAFHRHAPGTVAIPLGLFHDDHREARCAALRLMAARKGWNWLAYEEAIYRRIPGLVEESLAELRCARIGLEAFEPGTGGQDPYRKRSAVECYASQLRGLATVGRPGHADAMAPERYWRLEP